MKNLIILFLLMSAFALNAQVQFSIVCNQNSDQLEIVISGEEEAHHIVLKDKFPNQRVAEKYLNDNRTTLQCGKKPATATPPPTTAKPQNTPQTSTTSTTTSTPRRGMKYYPRRFLIRGGISKIFGLDELYPGNVEESSQEIGYSVGAQLFFGKAVMGGIGLLYTSSYGAFEDILLDVDFDDPELYGSLKSLKGEILLKSPVRLSTDNWLIFDFGFGYHFNVKPSIDEDFHEYLSPLINDPFYSLRWGIGVDIKGFNVMLEGEFLMGLSDDTDKESFFMLGLVMGYAF
jgi:hypothetical protein